MSVLSGSEVMQVLTNESVISMLGSLGFNVAAVLLEVPVNISADESNTTLN